MLAQLSLGDRRVQKTHGHPSSQHSPLITKFPQPLAWNDYRKWRLLQETITFNRGVVYSVEFEEACLDSTQAHIGPSALKRLNTSAELGYECWIEDFQLKILTLPSSNLHTT
jgi:hypothetical protein